MARLQCAESRRERDRVPVHTPQSLSCVECRERLHGDHGAARANRALQARTQVRHDSRGYTVSKKQKIRIKKAAIVSKFEIGFRATISHYTVARRAVAKGRR